MQTLYSTITSSRCCLKTPWPQNSSQHQGLTLQTVCSSFGDLCCHNTDPKLCWIFLSRTWSLHCKWNGIICNSSISQVCFTIYHYPSIKIDKMFIMLENTIFIHYLGLSCSEICERKRGYRMREWPHIYLKREKKYEINGRDEVGME